MVRRAMARRPGRPLVVVDLAVPRDVEPAVRDIGGVTLLDLDDVQAPRRAQPRVAPGGRRRGAGDRRRRGRPLRALARRPRRDADDRRAQARRRRDRRRPARAQRAALGLADRRRPRAGRGPRARGRAPPPPRAHAPGQAGRVRGRHGAGARRARPVRARHGRQAGGAAGRVTPAGRRPRLPSG